MNTVEGAMVFTSLAITVGLLVAGFSNVASRTVAESLARDAARVEAMGGDGPAFAQARHSGAQVDVQRTSIGGQEAVIVSVEVPAALFDVTGHASIAVEPTDY